MRLDLATDRKRRSAGIVQDREKEIQAHLGGGVGFGSTLLQYVKQVVIFFAGAGS